jgi:mannose-6-phosphate isomerase
MTTDPLIIQKQLQGLVSRYHYGRVNEDEKGIPELLLLNEQFPGDIGVFCAFMCTCNRGKLFFLPLWRYINLDRYVGSQISGFARVLDYLPGIYLADIIECMANSNNVIRAGLTPKLRDRHTIT